MSKQVGLVRPDGTAIGWQDPLRSGGAIVKSDSTTYDGVRGIYVGTAGDLAVLFKGDADPVTLIGVPAGSFLPFEVTKIMSTGTSASNIVVVY